MNEWECPKDCPNRHLGCQNVSTCETYRLRVERDALISGSRRKEAILNSSVYELKKGFTKYGRTRKLKNT
jgi:hypothetical protein